MLLLSPEDDSASLSIESLHDQPDAIADCQSEIKCYQAPLTDAPANTDSQVSGSKAVEGDRKEASVRTAFAATRVGDRSALPSSVLAQSSHRQNALEQDTYLPETTLDGLYALRAAKPTALRQLRASAHRLTYATLPAIAGPNIAGERSGSYAAPLASLRERDITALAALFQRDDIGAIEADVSHRLRSLLPEPCWDDDVFAFLQEFLADR